ncbi:glycosyltransferase [Ornithinimicrobium cerasi]|uniref:glycosyltransferase n=1 Tax=Ornithinimicrobium cerasi TaxID=2248773 RepID=UPI000F00C1AD|nr:glycosyltransferase [Ornithinimicrobium cerasi]
MRIALLAAGSRGDYQPVVAVGRRLAARGHDVGVTATREYADLVTSAGLQAELVHVDAMAYYREHLARHGMPVELRPQLRMLQGLAHHMAPAVLDRLHQMRGSYDGVVTTAMTAGWPGLSGWRVRPVLMMFVPALPSLRGDASLFSVVEGRSWRNLRAALGALPTAVRLVAPHPRALLGMASTRAFVAHTPRLVATGRVAGRQVRCVGYPFPDLPPGAALPGPLAAWLDEGEPPVYVGMGSHTLPAVRQVLEASVRAAGELGMRVVLQAGSGLEDGLDPTLVRPVNDVPHALLLPRTSAVVHHGGAGTTASALLSGRPEVVVPFTMDQPFFARRLHEIGVAAPPVPAPRVSTPALRTALERAFAPEVVRRAREEAAAVAQEDGAGAAATAIEAALRA